MPNSVDQMKVEKQVKLTQVSISNKFHELLNKFVPQHKSNITFAKFEIPPDSLFYIAKTKSQLVSWENLEKLNLLRNCQIEIVRLRTNPSY